MAFCTGCGNEVPAGAAACPGCGKSTTAVAAPSSASAGGLTDNVAGALAYLFVPAIIFLVIEPYNKNRFVRFHSFQSLFYTVACIVVHFVLALIPLINLIAVPLFALGTFVLWIVLVLKAFQGQKFKLPVIGDMAEQQAGS